MAEKPRNWPPVYLTDEDMAYACRCSARRVRELVDKGELPAPVETPLGRRWLYEHLLEHSRRHVTNDIRIPVSNRGRRKDDAA